MAEEKLYTFIEPRKKFSFFSIKDFFRYKDLLYYMVLRDITVQYKQTILGLGWAILNPLFQIIIFSFIFGNLAGLKPDVANMPYPLFSTLAVIPWTYFSSSLSSACSSLITSSPIFTKVYFPRIIIPLTPVFSKLFDFLISMIILVGLMIYYQFYPGKNLVLVAWPLLIIIVTSAGLGFWLSALSLQYRDVRFALSFLLSVLLYAAPVAFPASLVKEKFGQQLYYWYAAYPMVGGIEGFRACFSSSSFPLEMVAISTITALLIFMSGLFYFKKLERYFADIA